MSKTFLYRFFGIGGIPTNYRPEIEREGIVLLDEGIRGSVTYINFRAPWRYSNWKRQWFASAIILTKTRLLALRLKDPIIDVPLTDQRFFRRIAFSRRLVGNNRIPLQNSNCPRALPKATRQTGMNFAYLTVTVLLPDKFLMQGTGEYGKDTRRIN